MLDSPVYDPDRGVETVARCLHSLHDAASNLGMLRLRDRHAEQLTDTLDARVEAAHEARAEVWASIETTKALVFDLLRITVG